MWQCADNYIWHDLRRVHVLTMTDGTILRCESVLIITYGTLSHIIIDATIYGVTLCSDHYMTQLTMLFCVFSLPMVHLSLLGCALSQSTPKDYIRAKIQLKM